MTLAEVCQNVKRCFEFQNLRLCEKSFFSRNLATLVISSSEVCEIFVKLINNKILSFAPSGYSHPPVGLLYYILMTIMKLISFLFLFFMIVITLMIENIHSFAHSWYSAPPSDKKHPSLRSIMIFSTPLFANSWYSAPLLINSTPSWY